MSDTDDMGFRRRRRDLLADIDEMTPHRFAIVVADQGDIALASQALGALSDELTAHAAGDRIIVASTKSPRSAAVLRALNALRRSGVNIAGLEFLDVVAVTDDRALTRLIDAWRRDANRGPARRRAEAIGGDTTLAALHRKMIDLDRNESGAARFVLGCAAFNTPGSEHGILALASRTPTDAAQMVGWALDRCNVAELTGTPTSLAVDDLLAILRTGGYAAERALSLVRLLPIPLEPSMRDELIRLAEGNKDLAAGAVALLGHVQPDTELRELLDHLVINAPTSVRASALTAASRLWGTDLRPVWHAWLGDKSAPLRETAEEMLGAYGDFDDIDIAADHLAKLIRRRPGQVSWHVPREAPLIELLSRHRGQPPVEAAFDDMYARWNRLNSDIHDWVRREHPDLVPDAGSGPAIADAQSTSNEKRASDTDDGIHVDDAAWPLPAIEVADGVVELRFHSTDMFDTKDRFEELCATQPTIDILEADRDVLYLDIDDPDPVALIIQLWADAGGNPVP